MASTTPSPRIEEHPDVAAMRARYDMIAETTQGQALDGLCVLTGMYLGLSPWILGFNEMSTLAVHNLVIGGFVALFGLGFAAAYGRIHGVSWVLPVVGVWTMLSPWLISGNVATGTTITNNLIVGALVTLLGLAAIFVAMRPERR
jgi:hypothetical protein